MLIDITYVLQKLGLLDIKVCIRIDVKKMNWMIHCSLISVFTKLLFSPPYNSYIV